MALARGNDIKLTKQMDFPHSLGLLYSAFTAFLGFEVNEGEYKVMGMAPYGKPRYVDKVWKVVRQNSDGSFALDMDYFSFHHSTEKTYSKKFVELFGEPRPPKLHFFTEGTGFPKYFGEPPSNIHEISKLNQHYADIAASIQKVTEELVLGMARNLQKDHGHEEPVHCRRRGSEQRREQPDYSRDGFRTGLCPARGRRRRRSVGRGTLGIQHAARQTPQRSAWIMPTGDASTAALRSARS